MKGERRNFLRIALYPKRRNRVEIVRENRNLYDEEINIHILRIKLCLLENCLISNIVFKRLLL